MPEQLFSSDVARSYNSFSGSDIRAMIGPYYFAELQAISYSITREKAPIYTMGSPDPRSFSRNKRGIAGSLIWTNFDRAALTNIFRKARGTFIANIDDIRPQYHTGQDAYMNETAIFQSSLRRDVEVPVGATIGEVADAVGGATAIAAENGGWKRQSYAWYSDQILPFDVTLAGANEVGAATNMKIYGVEILNEGSGISIDDAVTEMQATFIARGIEPWTAVSSPFQSIGANGINLN